MTFTLSVQLETSPGVFLELEDETNGREMGGGSFADRTITTKQRTVGDDQPWLRGTLVTASAPGNVVEMLEVWVTEADHYSFDQQVETIVKAITEQLSYQVIRTIGNSKETWTCMASTNVSVKTQKEYILATTGLISAQVPRLPDVTRVSV